jgi:hypothetical protein
MCAAPPTDDAGVVDAGASDAGPSDAGPSDGGRPDASCDTTQIQWTRLPANPDFDSLASPMQPWRIDGGVMLTQRGAFLFLDDALRETSRGVFHDGGRSSYDVARRRDGFSVLSNDTSAASLSIGLHHLSPLGIEDRPPRRFANAPNVFTFGQLEFDGAAVLVASRVGRDNFLWRWDDGPTGPLQLHSPPDHWEGAMVGDDLLFMNYSTLTGPLYTERLADGGSRTLDLIDGPPCALGGQFVLWSGASGFAFFSPGGPVQYREIGVDAGLRQLTRWSGGFDDPVALGVTEALGAFVGPSFIIKWNTGAYFPLGTYAQSIDRFDDDTLIVSRVYQDGGIDVGLVCDP